MNMKSNIKIKYIGDYSMGIDPAGEGKDETIWVKCGKNPNICVGCHKKMDYTEERKRKVGEASKGNKRALGHKHDIKTKKKISEASKKCG